MPLYDYRCPYCEHRFEEVRSIQLRHVADCPECGRVASHAQSRAPLLRVPGGVHGIVDYGDKDYARVHSEADLKREAAKRGLVVNEM